MLRWELKLVKDSDVDFLYFYPQSNTFGASGEDWTERLAIKPDDSIVNLRIVLGKKCQMGCKYCLPSHVGEQSDLANEMAPEELATEIRRVLGPRRLGGVLFFGGEPLLYFDKMKRLHAALSAHPLASSGKGNFFVATNGLELKNPEIVNWMIENRINVGVSWDGPAQVFNRGRDIMDMSEVRAGVKRLLAENWEHTLFMPVFSKQSPSLEVYVEYACNTLDLPRIPVYECSQVIVVDEQTAAMALPPEELASKVGQSLKYMIESDRGDFRGSNERRFRSYLGNSIELKKRFCHYMFDTDLNLDCTGDILFCKNAPKAGRDPLTGKSYVLGNIKQLPDNAPYFPWAGELLLNSPHSARFEKCHICLVKSMCLGGCPLSPPKYDTQNCEALFFECLTSLGKMLYDLSGGWLLQEVRLNTDDE